ncbi:hypothetical protein [Halomontanus rarus]|uniref:hypothetical protein n=1 Tax=Halomontanus rarus TaxID=3034020 RepID=UPI00307B59F4
MSAFLILAAVIALALVAAYWFPDATLRWTRNIVFARKVIFAVAAIIVAFIFIGTGVWPLVLIGAFTFAVAVWTGYFQFLKGEQVT